MKGLVMSRYSLSKKVMPGVCVGIHKDSLLMRRDTIVHELNKKQEIIDELAAALKDTCSTILDKDACSKICEECHVYIALQKVESNG